MLLHQAIKLGTVAVSQPGRIGYVAVGQFEQTDQVISLKPLSGLGECKHLHTGRAKRALHQGQRHQRRCQQRANLLNHVVKLAHIAGPRGGGESLECFWSEAAQALVVLAGKFEQKVIRQQRNVFAAF